MGLQIVGEFVGVASHMRDWHDFEWQLVRGCTRVDAGCERCTAEISTARAGHTEFSVLRDGPHDARWTHRVEPLWDNLRLPRNWVASHQWVFPCSQSDLFHEQVPYTFVSAALETMAAFPQYTFGICTKRAERMADAFERFGPAPDNVMVGVTVATQANIDRVQALATVDAKTRWVAVEPMLGPVDLSADLGTVVNWVTFGPEIGVNRRECNPAWARKLLSDCRAAGVPFFTKHLLDGQQIRERPCAMA